MTIARDTPIDAKAVRLALVNDGYIVVRGAVPPSYCEAVLEAIGQELDIWVDHPASWERVSRELDQVPLWGHQSLWNIRQLPGLHAVWSAVWGSQRLWVDRNSCRFTPPWQPGLADALPMHWDVDPRDPDQQWYQGIVALTGSVPGSGGFRCAPALMHNRDRWPDPWPTTADGTVYRPGPVVADEIVEVPLGVGDLLVFDHHLPHGTIRNLSREPRAVFYLQMFPAGNAEQAARNIASHFARTAPPWWRRKPGHDRVEPSPPATLNAQGKRLLGIETW